jgi:3-deoxy-D-manno-octulosonate 8-phosphate phosphatase (KDO 8-P phosphatase)
MLEESALSLFNPGVLTRARKIKLFLMDVDGTLTDGGACLIAPLAIEQHDPQSVTEMKVFNAQDGQGLSLAHTMGIRTGFITGRHAPAVEQRAKGLNVSFVRLVWEVTLCELTGRITAEDSVSEASRHTANQIAATRAPSRF